MKPVYYCRFDLLVTSANSTVTGEFEIDKGVKVITGLLLTADLDEQLYYRGSQSIAVNGVEYFPEAYESKLLMSGLGVNPNQRYYSIGRVETLNGKIKIVYRDADNPSMAFAAYRVSIYVRGIKTETS